MALSCYCNDYGTVELHHKSSRKARKFHTCGECGRPITPGESYRYELIKWEEGFDTYEMCSACAEIADATGCFARTRLYPAIVEKAIHMDGDLPLDFFDGLSPQAVELLETKVLSELPMEATI